MTLWSMYCTARSTFTRGTSSCSNCMQAIVPVASWSKVWSIRSAIGSPGLRSPSTRCSLSIWRVRFSAIALHAIRGYGGCVVTRFLLVLSAAMLALAPPASAGHVSANPQVSARLGERLSENSWIVIVDWSINCEGAASPNYTGNLNLVDLDTGERIYMGGTSSAGGS